MDYWTNNGYGMNGCGRILFYFLGQISQLIDFSQKMNKYMQILWFFGFICHFRNENN
jgi:hypothetical protein